MKIACEPYCKQVQLVPGAGRYILAHFDDQHIVVYQAYRPETAHYVLEHGIFGGPNFSYRRMSWVKTSFLWMMYRCGWATKAGQERVLAIWLRRTFFEQVLAQAVLTTFDERAYPSLSAYQAAFRAARVRLQWDPDRLPTCARCGGRRAIQLGLRGSTLEEYGQREIVEVIDMTAFVKEQRSNAAPPYADLVVPVQRVYEPASRDVRRRIQLSEWDGVSNVDA